MVVFHLYKTWRVNGMRDDNLANICQKSEMRQELTVFFGLQFFDDFGSEGFDEFVFFVGVVFINKLNPCAIGYN